MTRRALGLVFFCKSPGTRNNGGAGLFFWRVVRPQREGQLFLTKTFYFWRSFNAKALMSRIETLKIWAELFCSKIFLSGFGSTSFLSCTNLATLKLTFASRLRNYGFGLTSLLFSDYQPSVEKLKVKAKRLRLEPCGSCSNSILDSQTSSLNSTHNLKSFNWRSIFVKQKSLPAKTVVSRSARKFISQVARLVQNSAGSHD